MTGKPDEQPIRRSVRGHTRRSRMRHELSPETRQLFDEAQARANAPRLPFQARLAGALYTALPFLLPVLLVAGYVFHILPDTRHNNSSGHDAPVYLGFLIFGSLGLTASWTTFGATSQRSDGIWNWPMGGVLTALGLLLSPPPLAPVAHTFCWVPLLLDAYFYQVIARWWIRREP